MKDTLCMYHAGCYDGFASAWIVRETLGDRDVDFIPWYHGTQEPDYGMYSYIYILDLMPSLETFEHLLDLFDQGHLVDLTILDHHKTAYEALAGHPRLETKGNSLILSPDSRLMRVEINLAKSGAGLTWRTLREERCPPFIQYIEDRDLWNFALPDSKAVNEALRTYPLTFESFDKLSQVPLEDLKKDGKAMRRCVENTLDILAGHASMVEFDGFFVPCVNSSMYQSELGNKLCQGYPFAIVYFLTATGKVIVSLRSSDGGQDVSAIAQRYGGGGHQHAAGLQFGKPADVPWLP